ncbi:hypothetical protein D3C74_319670 [compost metagenome]
MTNQTEVLPCRINDDIEDTNKIVQITFFDDINAEDIRKTKWLLGKYTDMIDIIKNYEYALQQIEDGLDAYQLLTAEGTAGKRETGQELTADVTANSVVLKDKRHTNYKFYLYISNNVKFAINNLRDPHEGLIAKLLFLDGMRYLKAQEYLEKGYRKDVYQISATTFAEKRRKAIAGIANSLKINRTLDFIIIDYGRGRNQDGEIGLRLPGVNQTT